MGTAVTFAALTESWSAVTVTCCSRGIRDCPVTTIMVTHCDGRDSTDVRYPPLGVAPGTSVSVTRWVQNGVLWRIGALLACGCDCLQGGPGLGGQFIIICAAACRPGASQGSQIAGSGPYFVTVTSPPQ